MRKWTLPAALLLLLLLSLLPDQGKLGFLFFAINDPIDLSTVRSALLFFVDLILLFSFGFDRSKRSDSLGLLLFRSIEEIFYFRV